MKCIPRPPFPGDPDRVLRAKVEAARAAVKKLLDHTRNPCFPADVPHDYADKFTLVEHATDMLLASSLRILESLGLSNVGLSKIKEWATTNTVTLRFNIADSCKFLKKTTEEVPSPTAEVVKIGGVVASKKQTFTTVHTWHWELSLEWSLSLVRANDKEILPLASGKTSCAAETPSETTPYAVVNTRTDELDVTWLAKRWVSSSDPSAAGFTIDRSLASTRTPRRNEAVDGPTGSLAAASRTAAFLRQAVGALRALISRHPRPKAGSTDAIQWDCIEPNGLFCPIAPFFENTEEPNSAVPRVENSAAGARVCVSDGPPFMQLYSEQLAARVKTIGDSLAPCKGNLLIDVAEASAIFYLKALEELCSVYSLTCNTAENMLRAQLIAAVGKVIQQSDFDEYMTFHYRKLYSEEFRPKALSLPVRLPGCDPEGVVSIEAGTEPLRALTRVYKNAAPMKFAISASVSATCLGTRELHGVLLQKFSTSADPPMHLKARARQFSGFIMLVGRIASATEFDPKAAMILQNEDDLSIPINLERIPTAAEFKKAIESLSPEQRRFAQAYRAMQLESTLFGVLVLQIKPQLEKLLRLPAGCLTKEIKLTQDLLELFIKYSIPSDLLTYDGPDDASAAAKVSAVKEHVAHVNKFIAGVREDDLALAKQEADYVGTDSSDDDSIARGSVNAKVTKGAPRQRSLLSNIMKKSKSGSMARGRAAPAMEMACDMMAEPMLMEESELCEDEMTQDGAPNGDNAGEGEAGDTETQHPEDPQPASGALVSTDFTAIPAALDALYEKHGLGAAFRPTILHIGPYWNLSRKESILAKASSRSLGPADTGTEKNQAYDLIDSLSRSGSLPFEHATLHVIVAGTHTFDKTVVDTVVQDNENPITLVERSSLIFASIVYDCNPLELLAPSEVERIQKSSPKLLIAL